MRLWELEARAQGCSLLSPRLSWARQARFRVSSYFWPKRLLIALADCSAVREINNFICLERARSDCLSVRRWPLRAPMAAPPR